MHVLPFAQEAVVRFRMGEELRKVVASSWDRGQHVVLEYSISTTGSNQIEIDIAYVADSDGDSMDEHEWE